MHSALQAGRTSGAGAGCHGLPPKQSSLRGISRGVVEITKNPISKTFILLGGKLFAKTFLLISVIQIIPALNWNSAINLIMTRLRRIL